MSVPVDARCLCGSVQEVLHLEGEIPRSKHICHCNHCRYTTGVLFLSALPLTEKPLFADRLTKYDTSEKVSRYFCPTCGTHLLCNVTQSDGWALCSGAVDRIPAGLASLEQWTSHEFVGDTRDGGLSTCLANVHDRDLEFFLQGPDQPPVKASVFSAASADGAPDGLLHASCHCGGVQYSLTRPGEASRQCSSPWPDLIIASESAHTDNKDDVKWWLQDNDTKYLAGTCACRSCRLASSVAIQCWAFVPKVNIKKQDGSPWDFSSGTLRQYNSSSGCYREFCGKCGATAFWHCDARPELIDVSVGLLRAPEGARAERWLKWWTERVSFKEDALDKGMVESLEKGLKALA